MEGLKLEAMNSELEYTGIKWCRALAKNEKDGTDSPELLQFTQTVWGDVPTRCQRVNNLDTSPGIAVVLEPFAIGIPLVFLKQIKPGLALDSWAEANRRMLPAASTVRNILVSKIYTGKNKSYI